MHIEIIQPVSDTNLNQNKPNLMTKSYYYFREGLIRSSAAKRVEKLFLTILPNQGGM